VLPSPAVLSRRAARLILGGAFAFGLGSVLCAAWQQDWTYDEPYHLRWSERLLDRGITERESNSLWNSKTPITIPYVLAGRAAKVLGLREGRPLMFATRLPGVLAYLLLVVASFALARRYFGESVAALAAAAVAIEPSIVANAPLATVDVPYALATLLALYAALVWVDKPDARRALGIGLALVTIPAMGWIAHTLGARDVVLDQAVRYGRVLLLALPVAFPTWTVFTALRCIGYPRMAMSFMLASAVLNAALDPVLIFGWAGLPALGVAGAAWASLLSFAITVGTGVLLFFAGAFPLRLTIASVRRARLGTMFHMLRIGIPAAIASVSFSLGRLVMMPMIATFGAPAIAVYGAGNRVLQILEIGATGIQMGMAALIGQALGRQQQRLAWRTATHGVILGVALMTGLAALCAVYAEPLIRIFFDEPEYVKLGILFFRIHAVALPFMGAFVLYDGVFSGSGNTVPPMVIGSISQAVSASSPTSAPRQLMSSSANRTRARTERLTLRTW